MSLDGGDHAGHDIVPIQQASDFSLDGRSRHAGSRSKWAHGRHIAQGGGAVLNYLREQFGATIELRSLRKESVSFPLPKELGVRS